MIAGDRIVGLRGLDQVEQIAIGRVAGLVFLGQGLVPDGRAVEIVDHLAYPMRLQYSSELWVPARGTNLPDLLRAGE